MNSLPPQPPKPETPKKTSPSEEINTLNFAMVAAQGNMIGLMHPMAAGRMTKQQARVLAAYLISMTGGLEPFMPVLAAVEAT